MGRSRAMGIVGVVLALSAPALADTLVLRDGRRVQGQLTAVRDGVIEFDAQRGLFGGRERMRLDRDEVVRIEFDESGRSSDRNRYGTDDRGHADERDRAGMRERSVTVNAAQGWSDTGVTVRAGQTVYFSASGRVRWGPGRQDGPAGEHKSPRNDSRPLPNRPAAALIGRVGDSNDYFFIGEDTEAIRVRQGGRLFLGVNDDFLQDNSGAFRVTVYY